MGSLNFGYYFFKKNLKARLKVALHSDHHSTSYLNLQWFSVFMTALWNLIQVYGHNAISSRQTEWMRFRKQWYSVTFSKYCVFWTVWKMLKTEKQLGRCILKYSGKWGEKSKHSRGNFPRVLLTHFHWPVGWACLYCSEADKRCGSWTCCRPVPWLLPCDGCCTQPGTFTCLQGDHTVFSGHQAEICFLAIVGSHFKMWIIWPASTLQNHRTSSLLKVKPGLWPLLPHWPPVSAK